MAPREILTTSNFFTTKTGEEQTENVMVSKFLLVARTKPSHDM